MSQQTWARCGRRGLRLFGWSWLLACLLLLPAERARAVTTYTVTTTADSGTGSLRQAILDANANAGLDYIVFAPGLAGTTIRPTSPLPAITDPVEISGEAGTSCTHWPPQPKIELDGSLAGPSAAGLTVQADGSVITGFYINRFSDYGIAIYAANVKVSCNIIGLDTAGAPAGNGNIGVLVEGNNNIVGYYVTDAGNVISANNWGIYIQGATQGNIVRGNHIGTDVAGVQDRGNLNDGILAGFGATGTTIGGVNDFDRNVISGNDGSGVTIYENGASVETKVQGNFIGITAGGEQSLPNSGSGVTLWDANNTIIGGVDRAERNRIDYNGGQGVTVAGSSAANRILGNELFNNGALGIDLDDDGVTANDPGDSDSGANNRQNYPVISDAYIAGDDTVVVRGALSSTPAAAFRLEFFASPACDASGFGPGVTFLGSSTVQTDGSGASQFTVVLEQGIPAGQQLTATATDNGGAAPANTSEFSACKTIATLPAALVGLPLPRRDVATTAEDTPITIDVLANDRDPQGDPLTLAAVGSPNAGATQIVDNKVRFTPAPNFNGAVAFFYSLHDGNPDNTVQANVNVQVNPVNDAPTNILLTPSAIGENLPASSLVGELTAVDVDDSSGFDFSLVGSGNDNNLFMIVGANGRKHLWSLTSFDFETKASYTIGVRVRDSGGATFDKSLTIAVVNGNDAPTAITLSNNRLDENQAAGVTVGSLSSVDSDPGDSHTYTLVSGTGSDDNAAFRISGAALQTNALLDYEARPIYSVRVRSSDLAGASREQVFLIYLNDVPSPPDPGNTLAHCSGNPITLIDANGSDPVKRVLVRIDNVVVSNKSADSCTVEGKLTIITNGNTVSNLAFSGDVNERNQFDGDSVEIPDFALNVAGLPLLARGVEIEYYVERAGLRITKPALQMPAEWGGLSASLSVPTLIDSSGVKIGTGTINLPTIKTKSGFELDLSGSLVPAPGGYRINADGSLTIPNIGKKKAPGAAGQTCAIGAGVTIYAGARGQTVMEITAGDALTELSTGPTLANLQSPNRPIPQSPYFADVIRLDAIRASLGCDPGIAIGSTGLFLTSVSGEIQLEPNNERVNVQVKIEAAKKLPGIGPVVDLDGTMDLKLNPAFRMDLGVALNVLSFEIARADATITKSSFSTTINITAVILHGTATINAWSTDGKFHFTGSGRMAIEVRKGSIAETCADMPCGANFCSGWLGIPYPCGIKLCPLCISFPPFSTGRLAEAGVDVGEFTNGRYGFKGYVGVLGQTVGFYVDERGSLSFSNIERYQLIQGPTVALAHLAWLRALKEPMTLNAAAFANYIFLDDGSGQSSGVIIRTPLVKPTFDVSQLRAMVQASDVISKVNLVRHGDVGFTLKARGPLAFSLITPQGQEVTPANFSQVGQLGYVIAYTQSVTYEPEDNLDELAGTDPSWPRLRFTPLSAEADVNGVDFRIDGAIVYSNVDFDRFGPVEPIILPAGAHTLELVTSGTNNTVLITTTNLVSYTDYTLLVIPPVSSARGAAPQAVAPRSALSELVLLADDNAPPAAQGMAKVRFVNAASFFLDMWIDGAPEFTNIYGDSPYSLVPAGTYTIEFRYAGANQLASPPLVVDLADGGIYTFFTTDYAIDNYFVASMLRQDASYAPTYLMDYAVDQAGMGEEWQVKLVGDTDHIPYLLSLAGPANPPVLASVTADPSNPAATQVRWQLTSDWSPTRVTVYVNPGAISASLTVTDPVSGIATTQEVPLFEGFPVGVYTITNPAELGGQLVTRQIDLSTLASGNYHLWVRVEDGVNPPVNVYAVASAMLASAARDEYGFNAVRVAKAGYDPMALLAGALPITIDHAADFPTSWNAAITTTLDAATDALYVEWQDNPHPDVDNYRLTIGHTPLAPTQVITAGGAVVEYDGNGQATGLAVGFILLSDIEPGLPYFLAVDAVDTESGRSVRSQEVQFSASAGAFALTTPQTTIALPNRGAATVPVTLNQIQPLFYPQVGLALNLSGTPLGVTASFAGDTEGTAAVSAAQPTRNLLINVDAAVTDGRYPLVITGYNGALKQTLMLELVVGTPPTADAIYLPLVER